MTDRNYGPRDGDPPYCFNCQDPCRGCNKVADPAHCMNCTGCQWIMECSVSAGKFLSAGKIMEERD